jgi:glycine cleavage system regulatory protein
MNKDEWQIPIYGSIYKIETMMENSHIHHTQPYKQNMDVDVNDRFHIV